MSAASLDDSLRSAPRRRPRRGLTPWALLASLALLLTMAAPAVGRLTVMVTIPPHASLVEQLAGDWVDVLVVLRPGESPATYDPSARQLEALTTASIWFLTGAPLEPSLQPRLTALVPGLECVATGDGLAVLAADDHHGHDHGDVDPHVWLSARNTARQVAVMADVLARHLPEHRDAIDEARADLEQQLRDLDVALAEKLAPVRGRTLFVFHPAFAYFCHDYDLRQIAIESGGLAPSPKHLATVLGDIQAEGARTIFLQPQYSDQVVRSLAREADLEVVILDPLARDHLPNLWRLGNAIAAGLAVQQ